jgi:hypothetical protein
VSLDLVRDYVTSRQEEARKAGDKASLAWVDSNDLAECYNKVIVENLERRQQLTEEDQLRQSSVLQTPPVPDPKMLWLDRLQRGR